MKGQRGTKETERERTMQPKGHNRASGNRAHSAYVHEVTYVVDTRKDDAFFFFFGYFFLFLLSGCGMVGGDI